MERLIIGRKSRNRKLFSIFFFTPALFVGLQLIENFSLLVLGIASLQLTIAVLILKYVKNIEQLYWEINSQTILIGGNIPKFNVPINMVNKLIEVYSIRISTNLNPLNTSTNYAIHFFEKDSNKREIIFCVNDNDQEAIENLHQLKKQIALARHKKAKIYAQTKKTNK